MPGSSPLHILAIDGGGVRGIVAATWADRLERELGAPLREHVDLFAGTSTGSIIACGLAAGMPAHMLIDLYRQLGRRVFPRGAKRWWSRSRRALSQGLSAPRYDDAPLAHLLMQQFGRDTAFGSLARPTLVTSYDVERSSAVVFKSFRAEHAAIPVWSVVKASCAAPTYFPAHVLAGASGAAPVALVDGGVVANNPTACALAEALRATHGPRPSPLKRAAPAAAPGAAPWAAGVRVVSLGTGERIAPITAAQARNWGALQWARPIVSVLMDGAGDAVDYIVRQIIGPDRYVRLQFTLPRGCGTLDDARAAHLNQLATAAQAYLHTQDGRAALQQAVKLLRTK